MVVLFAWIEAVISSKKFDQMNLIALTTLLFEA